MGGRIGVLALQGDVREHLDILRKLKAESCEVRTVEGLSKVDALILPGGESTAIRRLLASTKLDDAITKRAKAGMPLLATCAGTILLAKEVEEAPFTPLGIVDISVKRNAYGSQLDSFEDSLILNGKPLRALFIRAPVITRVGKAVEVLAEHKGSPVLVRQGNILCSTFHPELCGEEAVHALLKDLLRER